MRALLESPKDFHVPGDGAGRLYFSGQISARNGGKHDVVLCFSGVGNNSAALRAALLLEHFPSIDSIIMVGIAGGVPNPAKVDEHVRLGDIVVSDQGGVVQYDFVKEAATTVGGETTVNFTERNPPRAPSAVLLEAVTLLEIEEYAGNRPWVGHIDSLLKRFGVVRPPPETDILVSSSDPQKAIVHPDDPSRIAGQPRRFSGRIASANILLKNPKKRDYLREKFQVKAIEMESSGIADAAWNASVGYLVVRGICDYCDSNKGDGWQQYAAIVAAGYARALIESLPVAVGASGDSSSAQRVAVRTTVDEYLDALKVISETVSDYSLDDLEGGGGQPKNEPYVPLLLRRANPMTDDQMRPIALASVLDEERDEPHVMFVGPGGAGKSTLTRRIARYVWESPELLGLKQRYLPMIVRLSAFAATEHIVVEKKLRDALYKAGELSLMGDLPEGFFKDWSSQTGAPWFLLFDGLDEVSSDQVAVVVTQLLTLLEAIKAGGHRAAVTSRPGVSSKQLESKLAVYQVLGFTAQQQKQFAESWFGTEAERFISEVRRLEAADLSGNPLLFAVAAVVFRRDGQLVKTKVSLYGRFVQIWLDVATKRGLKSQLGDDVFDLVPGVLEELALKMTEQPGEGSLVALSRLTASYLKDALGLSPPKAFAKGKSMVEILGLRSGVFIRNGNICDWIHANFREYLAARALETQLLSNSADYASVLGAKPFDGNWSEVVSTLVQLHGNSTELLNWIAVEGQRRADAESVLLVHYYWAQSLNRNDPELCKTVVDVLLLGLADWRGAQRARELMKASLVEMGHLAVPALLTALEELNGLQAKTCPGWIKRKPPEIYGEPGNELYGGYKKRRAIVEVFGQIKDIRTIEPLIALLDDDKSDSYRLDMRADVQRALTCIGESAVAPLLKVIGNATYPYERRRRALVALKLVGRRTREVSVTLDQCLREGLSGNHDLLKSCLFAATALRDQNQRGHAAEALKFEDQEVVGRAADFFAAMPDVSVFAPLSEALTRWRELKPHSFSSDLALKDLLSALVLTSHPSGYPQVLRVLTSSLRGNGELGVREALRLAGNLSINGIRRRVLISLLAQLQETEPSAIQLNDRLEVLSSTWRPDELAELVKSTERIEAAVGDVGVGAFISRYLSNREASGTNSMRAFVDGGALLGTLAKCQVRTFTEQAGRLLLGSDEDFQREVSDVLWIAGGVKAEASLLLKLESIKAEHASGEDGMFELYSVLRALGTCGTAQGADMVIETVLRIPRVNIEFSYEVLCPLLRREMLDADRLMRLAENASTHKFARNFFVEALGYFNAPAFGDFFCRMLSDEDETVRFNAARFLGWSSESKAVSPLRDLLQETQSASLAEAAAKSLVRLKASNIGAEIIKAIERFGPAQRDGLIREAARLKEPAVLKYLKGTTRGEEWTPWERGDLLDAVGEFYDEVWARTILEEWLENTRIGVDTGQQRWAFRVLYKRDPNKLLEQAVRLYDEDGLEHSARSMLVDLVARSARKADVNPKLLLPVFKRFLCDEDVAIRESVAEELIYLSGEQRWRIYEELSVMGSWAQACGVYSLGFWDSDESEIDRMRYSPVYVVRYFADLAVTMRRKRPHLLQLADSFTETEGSARVSSYLSLVQEGSEQLLPYIEEKLGTDCIASMFLTHMQSGMESRAKKRRESLMKKEQELFCKSSRQVAFT